ncbi:MAG: polyprenyl synthetase family protein [Odoribacter sp.]|nr:polyprenyl synthetase family protein [Odoribacter sp.]
MTVLDSIKTTLGPDLKALNLLIREHLMSGNTLMDTVIESYLTTKGKQIRPIIVMLCAGMFGEIDRRVLEAAAAVELLHNASLIHDDVVDDSKLRRNKPTINAVWDNHIAVLVGDFFVSTALQRAIDTGDMRIIESIGALGKLLSLGEIDQIYNAREHTVTEESYFKIIDYKTASLFVACARVGCYAVNASDEHTELLAEVARLLGLCFQIRDDIFDYFDPDKVGKPTGNDLREGKITLPLLYALGRTDLEGHQEMNALAARPVLDEAQIARLIAFARDNGGIDYAYGRMSNLRQRAEDLLQRLPSGVYADQMRTLFDYIIARDY